MGGKPLFAETQTVTPDATGNYKVQLGATLANGLPADLFLDPRGPLVSRCRPPEKAPASRVDHQRSLGPQGRYSATLGGLPASAFVLAGSKGAADLATAAVSTATATASSVTTTGGTSGYLAEFSRSQQHRRFACFR